MYRAANGSVEFAMAYRQGADGSRERCVRPPEIREVTDRVQRWVAQPETCKSCQRLPAVRVADARALCSRCYAHYQERSVRRFDEGLRTVVTRADTDTAPASDILQGYAIRFNEQSVELYGFYEYIRPSAADRMMAEKPDVRALWNHGSDVTLARYSAGTLRLAKRSGGVQVEIDPPRWAANHVESVERRDITGMSFGFIALDDEWWLEEGIPNREVLDMEVIEVSPVSFPAYPTTSLAVVKAGRRSDVWRDREREHFLRFA